LEGRGEAIGNSESENGGVIQNDGKGASQTEQLLALDQPSIRDEEKSVQETGSLSAENDPKRPPRPGRASTNG